MKAQFTIDTRFMRAMNKATFGCGFMRRLYGAVVDATVQAMLPQDAAFYFDDHDPTKPQVGQKFIDHFLHLRIYRDIGAIRHGFAAGCGGQGEARVPEELVAERTLRAALAGERAEFEGLVAPSFLAQANSLPQNILSLIRG